MKGCDFLSLILLSELDYKTDWKNYSSNQNTFENWWFEYWWIAILVILFVLGTIIWFYEHITRMHNITLYIDAKPTIIQIQHGKTFSAPIPEGTGVFKGWFRDSACMIPYNSSDKVVSDFSLYSKFE